MITPSPTVAELQPRDAPRVGFEVKAKRSFVDSLIWELTVQGPAAFERHANCRTRVMARVATNELAYFIELTEDGALVSASHTDLDDHALEFTYFLLGRMREISDW